MAIKKLKSIGKKQRVEFVREAKVMRRLNHPNIVKVYGVAPQQEPSEILLLVFVLQNMKVNFLFFCGTFCLWNLD